MDYSFLPGYTNFLNEDEITLIIQGFWAKVLKRPNGCWDWMGAFNSIINSATGGVGDFTPLHRLTWSRQPRRVAWTLVTHMSPPFPPLISECGNSRCVNPDHMSQRDYFYK